MMLLGYGNDSFLFPPFGCVSNQGTAASWVENPGLEALGLFFAWKAVGASPVSTLPGGFGPVATAAGWPTERRIRSGIIGCFERRSRFRSPGGQKNGAGGVCLPAPSRGRRRPYRVSETEKSARPVYSPRRAGNAPAHNAARIEPAAA